ncbi:ABC transporter ATP-binding protein [Rhodococcus sp. BL-253-APC-6A1W]|uniref:oligopeptide/dipeptide ABC transporter ATP-binding protein n=1 Tax=Rhodococcus sp. BL-253-APC-6A1W TaxID=2725307 RepID=UPI00146DA321|nr:ABC transporter ATP-binding protein [Rhodococcus sp. BL-253-APC-6A1W]NMD94248.1 ABC transporter ATP-binding protein [Rhodococcus sp. BL-253-APC-6A1W]
MTSTAKVTMSGLTVRIPSDSGVVHAASDVCLTLEEGRILALVGESGCGKSVVGYALCGLLPYGAETTGNVVLHRAGSPDVDLTAATPSAWRKIRGRSVGWIPQSAATYLTPVRTVGAQLGETCHHLGAMYGPDALLEQVGLEPEVARLYPHELSGGMAQRAAAAFALAGDPEVIIADEPTSNLDPALTEHTLRLLRGAADAGAAVLLISHDLATLPGRSDEVAVMYASRIVETGPTECVFRDPWHPYTQDLLAALPSGGLHSIPGTPPTLTDLPDDCVYHLRRPATGFSGGPTHITRHGDRSVRRLIDVRS